MDLLPPHSPLREIFLWVNAPRTTYCREVLEIFGDHVKPDE